MATFYERISDKQAEFLRAQPMFFVATAAAEGRINLSPKGYDTLRVLGPNRVAWLDLAGSGNETQAHLSVDGRVTVMTCNFQQPALIMRLYGHARSVMPSDAAWDALAANFTLLPGTRQIFDMSVESVQESCGYGVPLMTLEAERQTLVKYHAQAEPEAWLERQRTRVRSIDGLPVRAVERHIA